MTVNEQAEYTILKKYRKEIWIPFVAAIKEYRLLQEKDRIAVCISGGKDSMMLAKCLQLLCRHSEFPFEVRFLAMDPGYAPENRRRILENAAALEIPLEIFDTNIFRVTEKTDSPCYLCARMRRGHLYKAARDRGCNKIALGHHFDDVVETTLMSMLYGAEVSTMLPKLRSKNFEGLELIRPLYLVKERRVLDWQRRTGLEFLRCACRVAEQNAISGNGSKRQEMKRLVAALRELGPDLDRNLMHSMHNVNLERVVGFRQNGIRRSFLDFYDEE